MCGRRMHGRDLYLHKDKNVERIIVFTECFRDESVTARGVEASVSLTGAYQGKSQHLTTNGVELQDCTETMEQVAGVQFERMHTRS